jgi:uncharacterized membrane protein (DUF106 family)
MPVTISPDDPMFALFAIALMAFAYSCVTNLLMKRFGNPGRVKEIQAEMTRANKALMEAEKSGDEKRKKEAAKMQERVPELLKESMTLQFKPLVVTLPIFFGASWLVKQLFPNFVIVLGVYLPVFIQNLERFPNWRNTFGPLGWFLLAAVFGGLFIQFFVGKAPEIARRLGKK